MLNWLFAVWQSDADIGPANRDRSQMLREATEPQIRQDFANVLSDILIRDKAIHRSDACFQKLAILIVEAYERGFPVERAMSELARLASSSNGQKNTASQFTAVLRASLRSDDPQRMKRALQAVQYWVSPSEGRRNGAGISEPPDSLLRDAVLASLKLEPIDADSGFVHLAEAACKRCLVHDDVPEILDAVRKLIEMLETSKSGNGQSETLAKSLLSFFDAALREDEVSRSIWADQVGQCRARLAKLISKGAKP